jgi:Outer membrane protein beta-barrel domain
MRKVLVLSIALAIATTVSSQTYLLGGVNIANITKNASGETQDNNGLVSFNAGLLHRFDLTSVVDFETGLLLTGKGAKAETFFNGGNDYVRSTFNPIYLEVPLNAIIKVTDINKSGLFVHGGVYGAVGVAGKAKTSSKFGILSSQSEGSIVFNNDDPFTSEQEDANYNKLKRFDFGANFGVGVQTKPVLVRLNYGLGLAKIGSTESNNNADDKNKFRTLSLSLAFKL